MTILLVEDDQDDIDLFKDVINEIDKSIILIYAYDGHEALAILGSDLEEPHHIFLDINMPLMNGLECLETIAKQRIATGSNITILTTTKNEVTINRVRELGAAYMPKPDTFQALLESIRKRLLDAA
jgi:CheY-like chemotaxis protein